MGCQGHVRSSQREANVWVAQWFKVQNEHSDLSRHEDARWDVKVPLFKGILRGGEGNVHGLLYPHYPPSFFKNRKKRDRSSM